jgi:hypothetical protein
LGGIYIVPASGIAADVTIDHAGIENNEFGIVADGTAGGTIRAVVSGNTDDGIEALSSGSTVWVLVDETAVGNTGNGTFTDTTALK